ncbi:unnamed protein product [Phytophthora fragariaefolia]|uniref:Unnamed protein product n=1 Tax=Phytophthora fragariaefolia TaxID=1490495 RepID=A0A9W6XAL4_9STRA|nr:unnamed protein product [Phytophthora fragariaefolia]
MGYTFQRLSTLRLVIQQFKRCNPSWSDVQCVVVDKDFAEIGVFQEELPEGRILLRQFHAINYIQEIISKTEYGLDAIQRSRLKPLVSLNRQQRPHLRVLQEPQDDQSGEPQDDQSRRQPSRRVVDAQLQSPQDEPQSPQAIPQFLQDESQSPQDEPHYPQDGSHSSQYDLQLAQHSSLTPPDSTQYSRHDPQTTQQQSELDNCSGATNSADTPSVDSITSIAPQVIEILDEECDSGKDGAESSCFAKAAPDIPKRPRRLSVSRVVRPMGRPRRTQRQRQLERRKKIHELTALLHVHGKPNEDEGTRVNLAELRRRFDDEPVTYHSLHQ